MDRENIKGSVTLNGKKAEQLQKVIKPVQDFMNEYCSPHDMLVIQQGIAELFEGQFAIKLEVKE